MAIFRKKIVFLSFLIVSITATSQIKKIFYEDGKLKGSGKMVDEIKQGEWVYYHRSGEVLAKGAFNDGKEEGYWEGFIPDGKLYFKGNYSKGEKTGKWFTAETLSVNYYVVENYDSLGNQLNFDEQKKNIYIR
jgi:antitoxin component YwqK of YwqJK toxin-antitoxin module